MTLVAPVRRTDSGSGAFLGLASDGHQYWVKAPNNPQGIRTLAAEVIVHGVGSLLGAPVCQTALIDIPEGMNWRFTPQHRLRGGIGHASRNVENAVVSDEWEAYSSLDHNRERQASLFALWDLCMGGDPQWLHQVTKDYSIWTFDHGFWLGGDGDWSLESLRRVGSKPWQYDLDPGVTSARALHSAADAIRALPRESIRDVTRFVPIEWGIPQEDLDELADILFVRAEGVAERLNAAAENTNFA